MAGCLKRGRKWTWRGQMFKNSLEDDRERPESLKRGWKMTKRGRMLKKSLKF